MAEPVQRPPDTGGGGGGGGGGGLQAEMLGLPTWGWLALATAAGVGIIMWRKTKAPAATSQAQPTIQVVPDNSTGEHGAMLATLRDLQGIETTEANATPAPTPAPQQDSLPAVSNVKVTIAGPIATAIWPPVPGATWYTLFWVGPHGSTGGATNMVPGGTANLSDLNIRPGEWIKARVFPSKASGPGGGTVVRGPDTLSEAVTR